MNTEVKQLTFGEQLVGLTFNPSGDDKVGAVKRMFADIADLVSEEYYSKPSSELGQYLYQHTIGEILNAQMSAVKSLTLKY